MNTTEQRTSERLMKATFERNEGSFSKQAFKTTKGTVCVF